MQILCSTGALIGRPNGRDYRLLKTYAPQIDCDGFEFILYNTWYPVVGDLTAFLERLQLNIPVMHCEKSLAEHIAQGGEEEKREAFRLFRINCELAARLGCRKLVMHLWNGMKQVLPMTAPLFLEKINTLAENGKISTASRVLFVNDGSRDKTWEIIRGLAQEDKRVLGICQSRNRGHQNAVLAGLMEAKDHCDITISIDCDGQDDINAMDEMVDRYLDGYEVVYGVRSKRKTDTWFKRTTAEGFYKLMNSMGAEVVFNHASPRNAV